MKILVVHDIGVLEGGAETLITRTTRELESLDHTVRTLTSDSPAPTFADATFVAGDATIFGKLRHYLYNADAKRALSRELQTFKPDVVHLHTITKASPAIMRLLKDVPTVMTLHDYGLMYPLLHDVLPKQDYCGYGDVACCARHAGPLRYYFEWLRVHSYRSFRKNVTIYIAPSRFVARVAGKLGYEPVVPLVNGIDLSPVKSSVKRDPATILFVGRLEAEKGMMQLLDAFKLVRQQVPQAKLIVVGTGLLEAEIKSRIAAEDIQGVELKGQLKYAELPALYQRATVLAVPSLWPEPFGLIGPEAMQYGLPVVTSGNGGIVDWAQHERNSLVADPHNAVDFAAALSKLLTDTALHAKLSNQAIKDAQQFSMPHYASELAAIYERARTRHAA